MTKLYIIYEITPINKELNFSYVGSTENFIKRKSNHKIDCNNINSRSYSNNKYKYIRNNGGWDEFIMSPLEEYECENKLQARIREQYFIDKIENKLNMIKAYIGMDKQEYYEKYYKNNKEYFSKQHKNYRENNKEKIQQHKKEKILCLCCNYYSRSNKSTHERSKFHLAFKEQFKKNYII
jgi:hypothetical protein